MKHLQRGQSYKTNCGESIKIDYCYNPGLKFPGICKGRDSLGRMHTWDDFGEFLYTDRFDPREINTSKEDMSINLGD